MKRVQPAYLIAAIAAASIWWGCEKTVFETDPRFFNDAFHGNIVGKVVQSDSRARVFVSQAAVLDSTVIDSVDGTFRFEDLEIGNYDLTLRADAYRTWSQSNVRVDGGGTTYVGEIDFSTVPELVAGHYPQDLQEIVYNNRFSQLSISMTFTRPMDRESVEAAFSTDPPTEGIFYWGVYSEAPSYSYFEDAFAGRSGFDPGATITTFSKITAFTFRVAQKDSWVDTTYRVSLATTAQDTGGAQLRFPLEFSFSTVQSANTVNGIQTSPFHGDVDVDLLSGNGIQVTFPRRMQQRSTEAAISMTPDVERIYIWPDGNRLTIYSGGPFLADTTYRIDIDSTAQDLDGIALGKPFSFSFETASVAVRSSSPRNGELFVEPQRSITLWFNTYPVKSSVEQAFTISPAVGGRFVWGNGRSETDKTALTFLPSVALRPNTKYTVSIGTGATDLYGSNLPEPHEFAFVTRPE